jgi:membrane fusion protein, multidrug efflux system
MRPYPGCTASDRQGQRSRSDFVARRDSLGDDSTPHKDGRPNPGTSTSMAEEPRDQPASTTTTTQVAAPSKPLEAPKPGRSGRGWIWPIGILLVLGAATYFFYPRIVLALTTASTDDAYVNAHVTFLAPRISESVVEVRFDNNDFVKKGELVVVLDDAVEKVRVGQATAALDLARNEATAQLAATRAIVAQAKANRFKLFSAQTDVRNQEASLRAAIAELHEREAAEKLAKLEADRYATLAKNRSITQEQADIKVTDHTQAREATLASVEQIRKIRSGLEVPETPPDGKPWDDLPPDLDQKHSEVLAALGMYAYTLAELGVSLPTFYESPKQFLDRIIAKAPNGDVDALIEQTVLKAPAVESARSRVAQAEQDLALAQLNLSYCKVFADIDGFISNRNVNPGDRVAQAQRLMAIRSSEEIWVDCNFKETQIEPIRIGHPVDLHVDAYPDKVFKARVTGFNPGTGSSLALLPPQNATGNFVKIVQRLPVRVELVGPNPKDTPLFVGLSCIPYIKVYEKPEGRNAGQRLRGNFPKVGEESRKSR